MDYKEINTFAAYVAEKIPKNTKTEKLFHDLLTLLVESDSYISKQAKEARIARYYKTIGLIRVHNSKDRAT